MTVTLPNYACDASLFYLDAIPDETYEIGDPVANYIYTNANAICGAVTATFSMAISPTPVSNLVTYDAPTQILRVHSLDGGNAGTYTITITGSISAADYGASSGL